MNDRRRFLHVLGATSAAIALPACGGADTTGGGGGGAGGGSTTSTGGTGGAGSSTTATSSATSSATASATSSTGTGGCPTVPPGTPVGLPSDFAADGLHLVPNTKVLIGRDAGGLYALTSVCPHQFCDMDAMKLGQPIGIVTATGITCNCHGSKFDLLGGLVKGPALTGLKAFAMALDCEGKIYVDKTTVVASTERLNA
jgi:nitrite reductase/ring-hydroxylating ferredoxin subunit